MNLNKNKKVLLVLLLVLLMLGCGSYGVIAGSRYLTADNEEKTSVSESVSSDSQKDEDENDSQDTDSNENSDSSDRSSDGETDTTKSSNGGSTDKSNSSNNSGKSSNSNSNNGSSGNSSGNSSNNSGSSGSVQKPQPSTSNDIKTYNCNVTIECTVILDNMSDLKEGKEDYVPSNGYILKNCSIKAEEGESVYSLLQRVCDANGISYNAVNSGWGIYVSSINHLDEKDCGSGSGWKYKVNGTYPGRTCEKEKITKNSTIVWEFVTHP